MSRATWPMDGGSRRSVKQWCRPQGRGGKDAPLTPPRSLSGRIRKVIAASRWEPPRKKTAHHVRRPAEPVPGPDFLDLIVCETGGRVRRAIHASRWKPPRKGATRHERCPATPGHRFLDVRACGTAEGAIRLAHSHGKLSPRNLSAFWSRLAQLTPNKRNKLGSRQEQEEIKRQLNNIIEITMGEMDNFDARDLSGALLGMAKVAKDARAACSGGELGDATVFRELLLGSNLEPRRDLFQSLAIASARLLPTFHARYLSFLAYSYAIIEYPPALADGSILFDRITTRALSSLDAFNQQDLSILVWSYAKLGMQNPRLFEAAADAILKHDLGKFEPRHLSNIAWAYATVGEPNPCLFEKVAEATAARDLEDLSPQALSNVAWAFATAKQCHPKLFDKIADAAVAKQSEFSAQDTSNLLWAYALMGGVDDCLFLSFTITAAALIEECNSQNLANIAWAYAVFNLAAPDLFDDKFIDSVLKKQDEFNLENLRQLHQWHLWQLEIGSLACLPTHLQHRCKEAFTSTVPQPSAIQREVVCGLHSIGLQPEEEVLMKSGYLIDAVVKVDGQMYGVEVDGPSHFVGKEPMGKTILKRRQVWNIDRVMVVSVPYWEWKKVRKNHTKKQEYLRRILGME